MRREDVPRGRGSARRLRAAVPLALDLRRGDPGPLHPAPGTRRGGARGLRVSGDGVARSRRIEGEVDRLHPRAAGPLEDPPRVQEEEIAAAMDVFVLIISRVVPML